MYVPEYLPVPSQHWNKFDFVIVVISVVGVVADYCVASDLAILPLIRVLRVVGR